MASHSEADNTKKFDKTHISEHQSNRPSASTENSFVDHEAVDTEHQHGVQAIEAVTIIWSKNWLIIAYILIWFIYFLQGLVTGTSGALIPYVASNFQLHSLAPTTGVLSSVIGGVTNLTIAKILDIFGRPQGYLFCIFLTIIGLTMSAACNNVEAYAASQVFYTVGINGIGYSLSVFVADTSSLRNRGLMQAFVTSPNLITCWLSGPISSAFLNGAGFRWAFGMLTILVPVVTLPLFGLFWYHYIKAKKQGLIPKRNSGRNIKQSITHYVRELDALGLLLLSAGVAFFLLPFNLYAQQAKKWNSALIIGFLVVGIVLIISFAIWEKFFAPQSFIPWKLLRDRTVLGACLISFCLFASYFSWTFYFSSVLQVVNNLTVTEASYVVQAYTVGGVITSLACGAFIRYTGRYRAIALFFGVPFSIFGLGLLIHFRQPSLSVGYSVMCQIFISFGSGILVICTEIAIMAAAIEQQYFAISLALLGLFANIGGAIGLTISAAIWQSTFPNKLAEYLPAEELPNLPLIYADIKTQLSYPVGTPARLAIQHAYGDSQKNLLIAGTSIWVIGIVAVILWKDIKVIGIKQNRGHVA